MHSLGGGVVPQTDLAQDTCFSRSMFSAGNTEFSSMSPNNSVA
jgi:hypothetical protein